MQAKKLEERWTPTTIDATFALRDLPSCTTKSRHISILLPLLNHGWTFALSLAPERVEPSKNLKKKQVPKPCNWALTAFSFRQHDSKPSWGNASMQAQLSLHAEDPNHGRPQSVFDGVFSSSTRSDPVSLGSITVALAHTPSAELPVATSYTLSPSQTTKVSLAVTVSECPFADGLFQTQPVSNVGDTEAQTDLFRQSGDRVLSLSLTTGKLFDVKFLSSPYRFPLGSAGKLFPTYASLSVLEKHVSLPDSKLTDGWTAAFKAGHDHADPPQVKEISCPNEYEYELDSDLEDEDDAPSSVELGVSSPPGEPSAKGKQPERSAARSSGSLSSFDLGSDQGSVDDLPEEIIQDSEESSQFFLVATADCERTVLIKFAAHRTWHAFLWYCYTGHVEFNGLKSQSLPGVRRQRAIHFEDGPPSCSPKSMYRLADLVGNKDLKEKSLQALRERMTEANVLGEVFSIFTSKYPDVRELQLGVLVEHCASPEVKREFLKTMMKYSNMPHAEPVLSAFYDQLVA